MESQTDASIWTSCPPGTEGRGYLYVLQFSNGLIKIGRSANPRSRITTHITTAFAFGAELINAWVSEMHSGYGDSESRLLASIRAEAMGTQVALEYFDGADFSHVVALAKVAITDGDAKLRFRLNGTLVAVDSGRLTNMSRQIAEGLVAQSGRRDRPVIWIEYGHPLRVTEPNWWLWWTAEEAELPDVRRWHGWSTEPLGTEDPHRRLEVEAGKVPPGWTFHSVRAPGDAPPGRVSTTPQRHESFETDGHADSRQVLAYLNANGRRITAATWRAYVSRQQAPQPVRRIGRTPVWNMDEVEQWHADWQARADMTRQLVDNGIAGQALTLRLEPTTRQES